ncbi:unnamed protein product [Amoebophrya sp. A120]|nr:unnamed protein product [Amoebophrya sp. A120]|eukprot:GSA120T00003060001.1
MSIVPLRITLLLSSTSSLLHQTQQVHALRAGLPSQPAAVPAPPTPSTSTQQLQQTPKDEVNLIDLGLTADQELAEVFRERSLEEELSGVFPQPEQWSPDFNDGATAQDQQGSAATNFDPMLTPPVTATSTISSASPPNFQEPPPAFLLTRSREEGRLRPRRDPRAFLSNAGAAGGAAPTVQVDEETRTTAPNSPAVETGGTGSSLQSSTSAVTSPNLASSSGGPSYEQVGDAVDLLGLEPQEPTEKTEMKSTAAAGEQVAQPDTDAEKVTDKDTAVAPSLEPRTTGTAAASSSDSATARSSNEAAPKASAPFMTGSAGALSKAVATGAENVQYRENFGAEEPEGNHGPDGYHLPPGVMVPPNPLDGKLKITCPRCNNKLKLYFQQTSPYDTMSVYCDEHNGRYKLRDGPDCNAEDNMVNKKSNNQNCYPLAFYHCHHCTQTATLTKAFANLSFNLGLGIAEPVGWDVCLDCAWKAACKKCGKSKKWKEARRGSNASTLWSVDQGCSNDDSSTIDEVDLRGW